MAASVASEIQRKLNLQQKKVKHGTADDARGVVATTQFTFMTLFHFEGAGAVRAPLQSPTAPPPNIDYRAVRVLE